MPCSHLLSLSMHSLIKPVYEFEPHRWINLQRNNIPHTYEAKRLQREQEKRDMEQKLNDIAEHNAKGMFQLENERQEHMKAFRFLTLFIRSYRITFFFSRHTLMGRILFLTLILNLQTNPNPISPFKLTHPYAYNIRNVRIVHHTALQV